MPEPHSQCIYLYCLTSAEDGERFSAPGIGGLNDPPYVIAEHGLAAVASNLEGDAPEITKEILLAHQRVLEEVMQEHPILPIAFGATSDDAEAVRTLLRHNATDIQANLEKVADRVELGLKAFWSLETILKEVAETDPEIIHLKELFRRQPQLAFLPNQVEAGKLVEAALRHRKEAYIEEILPHLTSIAADHCLNQELTDEMILNAAFLVDKNRESQFDAAVSFAGERHKDHLQFLYSGPWPPYNFAQLHLSADDFLTFAKEAHDVTLG